MTIHCPDWQDALDYFLDPRIQLKMRRLKIHVTKMDWQNKEVHLAFDDDELFLKALSEIGQDSCIAH